MSFSVVVLSRKVENVIPCVKHVLLAEKECTIHVIDDGIQWENSGDLGFPSDWEYPDRQDRISEVLRRMQCQSGAKPFIFARNANIGIRASCQDDVILLNDDALLETTRGFTLLAAAAAAHPEFGVISAVTNVVGNLAQRPQAGTGLREEPRTLAFVCVYIPRATIDRVGLLDERYCLDYGVEDNDYCESVRRAGLKLGIFDGCYVDHGKLKSTFRGDPSRPATSHRNLALFEEKFGHPA